MALLRYDSIRVLRSKVALAIIASFEAYYQESIFPIQKLSKAGPVGGYNQ